MYHVTATLARTAAPVFRPHQGVGLQMPSASAGMRSPLGSLNSNAVQSRNGRTQQKHKPAVPRELRQGNIGDLWPQQALPVPSPDAVPGILVKLLLGQQQASLVDIDAVIQQRLSIPAIVQTVVQQLNTYPGGEHVTIKAKQYEAGSCNWQHVEHFMAASRSSRVLVFNESGAGHVVARIAGYAVADHRMGWGRCGKEVLDQRLQATTQAITLEDLAKVEKLLPAGNGRHAPASPSGATIPRVSRVSFCDTPMVRLAAPPAHLPASTLLRTPAGQQQPALGLGSSATPHLSSAASAPQPPSTVASSRPDRGAVDMDLDRDSGSDSDSTPSDSDGDWTTDDDEPQPADFVPVAKPVPARQPMLGDACRVSSGQPEECLVSNDPKPEYGLHLSKLPCVQRPATADASQPTTSRPMASKLSLLPMLVGNSNPTPWRTRPITNRDPDFEQRVTPEYFPGERETPAQQHQRHAKERSTGRAPGQPASSPEQRAMAGEEGASLGQGGAGEDQEVPSHGREGAGGQAEGHAPGQGSAGGQQGDLPPQAGAGGQGGPQRGEQPGGSPGRSGRARRYRQPNVTRKWKTLSAKLLAILAAFAHGAFVPGTLPKAVKLVEQLSELVDFGSIKVPAEAVEAVLAMCFENRTLDIQLPKVCSAVSHTLPGSVKWWRTYVCNLVAKYGITPLVFSRQLSKVTYRTLRVLKTLMRVPNPEDGTVNSIIPYSVGSFIAQKDMDVAKAKEMGYDAMAHRTQGEYGYMTSNLQSTMGLYVMSQLRSNAAVRSLVQQDPTSLSRAAQEAGADCELQITFVASVDAAKVSRANDKITTFAIGFAGGLASNMVPVGIALSGDSQQELLRAFGTSPADGIASLLKQLDQLAPFVQDLPQAYFNKAKLFINLKVALVADQLAMAALAGLEGKVKVSGKQMTFWTSELREQLQCLWVLVFPNGVCVDLVNGVYHLVPQPGCLCRGCSFRADCEAGKRGGHKLPTGPLTIKQIRQAFHTSLQTFQVINCLQGSLGDEDLAESLPASYKNHAVDWERALKGRYPSGSPLHIMQKMMRESKGRFFVLLRRPLFGFEGGYPNALCLAAFFIRCAYISIMHHFKAIFKRIIKILIHDAIDMDKLDRANGRMDSAVRVETLQEVCKAAGRPFTLGADKEGGQYPDVFTNWDFGPVLDLLKKKAKEMVEAVRYDNTSPSAADDGLQVNIDMAAALGLEGRSGMVLRHIELILELCHLVKEKGCRTDAEKERAAELATDALVTYAYAGFPKKKMSNYYLLLFFLANWQLPRNVNYLISGQFVNCPTDWDPFDRPVECIADVSDEDIERLHRVLKGINTNGGGGLWAQSSDTVDSDTVVRDQQGLLQILRGVGVQLLEGVEQLCPAPVVPRNRFSKTVIEDDDGQLKTVRQVLDEAVEMGLQYRTQAEGGFTLQEARQIQQLALKLALSEDHIMSFLRRVKSPGHAHSFGARQLPAKRLRDEELPGLNGDQQEQQGSAAACQRKRARRSNIRAREHTPSVRRPDMD